MTTHPSNVTVVGAGVIGLTTATILAEAGHHVTVVTADPPQATTSMAAGATWGPWLVEPRDRVLTWAAESLLVLVSLADQPDSGVRIATAREVSPVHHPPVDWIHLQPDRRPCTPEELPDGFSYGSTYTVPVLDMPVYLAYLENRLGRAQARVITRRLTSLSDLATPGVDAIVNCAGVGARDLVPDPDLYPVRGHHVVVTNPHGLTDVLEADNGDSTDLIAIYPHRDHVVLGGTAEPHVTHLEPDAATANAILERCLRLEPRLRDSRIIGHRIGHRPTRPAGVRFETQRLDDRSLLIHNYGHSGAGVSLAWGAARDVERALASAQTSGPGV